MTREYVTLDAARQMANRLTRRSGAVFVVVVVADRYRVLPAVHVGDPHWRGYSVRGMPAV